MGIRINKCLGWGLTDIKPKIKHLREDPRMNPDSPLVCDSFWQKESQIIEDWKLFIKNKYEEVDYSDGKYDFGLLLQRMEESQKFELPLI